MGDLNLFVVRLFLDELLACLVIIVDIIRSLRQVRDIYFASEPFLHDVPIHVEDLIHCFSAELDALVRFHRAEANFRIHRSELNSF